MTLHGHIHNGMVVFDSPIALPEGTVVRVEPVVQAIVESDLPRPSLADRLSNFLQHTVDLPADAATQHDHYLYGHQKR